MPIIPFIGIDGLERIIITSQRDDFSDQPNIKIFTKIPYFMNLQKRQFTGALSKLRKNR